MIFLRESIVLVSGEFVKLANAMLVILFAASHPLIELSAVCRFIRSLIIVALLGVDIIISKVKARI